MVTVLYPFGINVPTETCLSHLEHQPYLEASKWMPFLYSDMSLTLYLLSKFNFSHIYSHQLSVMYLFCDTAVLCSVQYSFGLSIPSSFHSVVLHLRSDLVNNDFMFLMCFSTVATGSFFCCRVDCLFSVCSIP